MIALTHSDIDIILERYKQKPNQYATYVCLLDELKPYIDLGLCKVRFTNVFADPSKSLELMDDMEKEGWCPLTVYEIGKYQHLRKLMFKEVAMMLVFKKLKDVKESQLMAGLKTSECIQVK
jgi:hypothetical protein